MKKSHKTIALAIVIKKVIDKVRGVNPNLESIFDQAYLLRPNK